VNSVYWVLSWACHRKCRHCYDDRFRPYVRGALDAVVGEGRAAYARIVENLPEDFTYRDPASGARKRGWLILAGGELLIDPVYEDLFLPAMDAVIERWGRGRGPRIGMQTTGDVLTERHLEAMLERGVWTIAVASIDDYHVGMEGEGKFRLMDRVRAMMAKFGVEEVPIGSSKDSRTRLPGAKDTSVKDGPFFGFFGAQPDLWIGELWPRGRAFANGLSKADYGTNFCARWSGGRNFLRYGEAGSEVAIEPDGSVYPCCLKTKAPLGNLTEERLVDILEDLAAEPALVAVDAGDPEAMGEAYGWSRADFEAASHTRDGAGREIGNLCLGCDRFFAEKLAPVLERRRAARLARAEAPAQGVRP